MEAGVSCEVGSKAGVKFVFLDGFLDVFLGLTASVECQTTSRDGFQGHALVVFKSFVDRVNNETKQFFVFLYLFVVGEFWLIVSL